MDTVAREEVNGKEDRAYATVAAQLRSDTAFCGVENYPQILWIILWILAAINFACF